MDERTQSGENSCAIANFEDDDDETSLMVDTTLELGIKEDLPKFENQEIDDEDLENPMDRLALVILVGFTVFISFFGLFYLLVLLIFGLKILN